MAFNAAIIMALLGMVGAAELADKLRYDAKVYCTVLEKVVGDGYFASITENLKGVFEAELRYAFRELARMKAVGGTRNDIVKLLQANMIVFKENMIAIVSACIERLGSAITDEQTLAGLVLALGQSDVQPIQELDDESQSETVSKITLKEFRRKDGSLSPQLPQYYAPRSFDQRRETDVVAPHTRSQDVSRCDGDARRPITEVGYFQKSAGDDRPKTLFCKKGSSDTNDCPPRSYRSQNGEATNGGLGSAGFDEDAAAERRTASPRRAQPSLAYIEKIRKLMKLIGDVQRRRKPPKLPKTESLRQIDDPTPTSRAFGSRSVTPTKQRIFLRESPTRKPFSCDRRKAPIEIRSQSPFVRVKRSDRTDKKNK